MSIKKCKIPDREIVPDYSITDIASFCIIGGVVEITPMEGKPKAFTMSFRELTVIHDLIRTFNA